MKTELRFHIPMNTAADIILYGTMLYISTVGSPRQPGSCSKLFTGQEQAPAGHLEILQELN
ncbi:hypothetical protein EYF80_032070 [Liparis tanakae]|uniref:Uncharacterized protein n=1 Tax=Liparis tanakae TaxID=230148 RepID=A0A4Z2GYG8_9TELE|nr:hypothetical protein EYF80_032070 [Liparis tanakae]